MCMCVYATSPFLLGKSEADGASPAFHLYKDLSEADLNFGINCVQILRQVGSMLILSMIVLPSIVALSHAVKQAMLLTFVNMWRLILNHPSEMGQPLVPSV